MSLQNGNVTNTLFSLYDELLIAKSTLESKQIHSPGWLYNRTKHKKHGPVSELFYVTVADGKRHYKKIDPSSAEEYRNQISLLKNQEQSLKYVNEQLRLLAKCFASLGIDPAQRKKTSAPKAIASGALYPQNLRHQTLNGEMVRSKSEVLLANLFYLYQVSYAYEKPLNLDGYTIHPDFTITLPTGKQIYWEHLGMLDNPQYAQNWAKKNSTYRQHGISEGHGLIITRDIDGVFDEQDALLKIRSYHLSPLLD